MNAGEPPDPSVPPPPPGVPEPAPALLEPATGTHGFAFGDAPSPRRRAPLIAAAGLLVALVGGLVAFALTGAGSNGGGSGIALALSFTRGEVQRFNASLGMNMTMSVAGRSIPISSEARGPESIRVTAAGGPGATLLYRVGPMDVTANGQQRSVPAMSIRLQIAPDGRILSGGGLVGGMSQALGGGSGFAASGEQIFPFLPDHTVSPGDSWDTNVDRSMDAVGSGALHYTAHSTFVRYARVHGVRAAMIVSQASIPMDFTIDLSKLQSRFGNSSSIGLPSISHGSLHYSGSVDSTTTSWLDLGRRRLERLASSGNMDVGFTVGGIAGSANPGEIKMTGTMTFVIDRRP